MLYSADLVVTMHAMGISMSFFAIVSLFNVQFFSIPSLFQLYGPPSDSGPFVLALEALEMAGDESGFTDPVVIRGDLRVGRGKIEGRRNLGVLSLQFQGTHLQCQGRFQPRLQEAGRRLRL